MASCTRPDMRGAVPQFRRLHTCHPLCLQDQYRDGWRSKNACSKFSAAMTRRTKKCWWIIPTTTNSEVTAPIAIGEPLYVLNVLSVDVSCLQSSRGSCRSRQRCLPMLPKPFKPLRRRRRRTNSCSSWRGSR